MKTRSEQIRGPKAENRQKSERRKEKSGRAGARENGNRIAGVQPRSSVDQSRGMEPNDACGHGAIRNLSIAELLAREAETASGHLQRAFKRAARRALLW